MIKSWLFFYLKQEPNNLKNVNSPRYNGMCKKKVLGIEPALDNKGIILSHKTSKYQVVWFFFLVPYI